MTYGEKKSIMLSPVKLKNIKNLKRVTAIRSHILPGLYHKARFVDFFDKTPNYNVQELSESIDQEYYNMNFFHTEEEMKESFRMSDWVLEIEYLIQEELFFNSHSF